jgi:outer membrane protein assembly factor BamB
MESNSVGFGDATPVLAGNKIYLNTRQGDQEVILCLDAATGKELWKIRMLRWLSQGHQLRNIRVQEAHQLSQTER